MFVRFTDSNFITILQTFRCSNYSAFSIFSWKLAAPVVRRRESIAPGTRNTFMILTQVCHWQTHQVWKALSTQNSSERWMFWIKFNSEEDSWASNVVCVRRNRVEGASCFLFCKSVCCQINGTNYLCDHYGNAISVFMIKYFICVYAFRVVLFHSWSFSISSFHS